MRITKFRYLYIRPPAEKGLILFNANFTYLGETILKIDRLIKEGMSYYSEEWKFSKSKKGKWKRKIHPDRVKAKVKTTRNFTRLEIFEKRKKKSRTLAHTRASSRFSINSDQKKKKRFHTRLFNHQRAENKLEKK